MTENEDARPRGCSSGRATRSKPALNPKSTARGDRTSGRRGRAPFPHLPLRRFHGTPERLLELLGLLEAPSARRCA